MFPVREQISFDIVLCRMLGAGYGSRLPVCDIVSHSETILLAFRRSSGIMSSPNQYRLGF